MEVLIGGIKVPVKVIRKKMKNLVLRVNKDGEIQVSAPKWAAEEDIKSLIYRNEAWILEQQLKREQEKQINQEGATGPVIYWFGEKKYVRYLEGTRDRMFIDGDIITFYLKEETEERIEKTFRKYANEAILKHVAETRGQWDVLICDAYGKPHPEISMQYMTSKWGVCYTQRAKIKLSTRLIHYPVECLDYVLLHEYTHFLVANHSRKFYDIILHFMPDYKRYMKMLK